MSAEILMELCNKNGEKIANYIVSFDDEQKIVFFPTIKFVDPLFDALSSGNIHFSHTFHIL